MRASTLILIVSCAVAASGCVVATDEELPETAEGEPTAAAAEPLRIGWDDVGVIPDAGESCPYEEILLQNDTENNANANKASGWLGRITWNTKLIAYRFCRVPGHLFRPFQSSDSRMTYAVLQLGDYCPAGGVSFQRRFDSEDKPSVIDVQTNSSNYQSPGYEGTAPNWAIKTTFVGGVPRTDRNMNLFFCLFRPSLAVAAWSPPDIGRRYGVFGSLPTALTSGWLYSDDEDDNNANALFGDYAGSSGVIAASRNTQLFLSRVR